MFLRNKTCTWLSVVAGFAQLSFAAPQALLPDPTGINKSRCISVVIPAVPPGEPAETALRVHLVSLHHVDPPYPRGGSAPFSAFEGESVWVGPPAVYVESTATAIPFLAAHTQCTPYYHDWSEFKSCSNMPERFCTVDTECPQAGTCTGAPLLHIVGSAIVPSSAYQVENLSLNCQGIEDGCTELSTRTIVETNRWGDMLEPFQPPDGQDQPTFADIGASLDKFRSLPHAVIKVRAAQGGNNAFGVLNFSQDVGFGFSIAPTVDAFRGEPYPFKMGMCAGAQGGCNTDAECTGWNAPPCILYCPD